MSGQYKKGKSVLRRNGRYCCLGVLCDLYAKEHPDAKWIKSGDFYSFSIRDNIDAEVLVPEVAEWSGISSATGNFYRDSLVAVNDRSSSFKPVIEFIEEHWREL